MTDLMTDPDQRGSDLRLPVSLQSGPVTSLVDEPVELGGRPSAPRTDNAWRDSSPGRWPPVRVLICDDHEVYRLGLRALLDTAADLILVAEADNPGQALQLAYENGPDVALVSQGLPGDGSLELIRRLSPAPHGRRRPG